jgi:hypothetical protein
MKKFELIDEIVETVSPSMLAQYLFVNHYGYVYDFMDHLQIELLDSAIKEYDDYDDYIRGEQLEFDL